MSSVQQEIVQITVNSSSASRYDVTSNSADSFRFRDKNPRWRPKAGLSNRFSHKNNLNWQVLLPKHFFLII